MKKKLDLFESCGMSEKTIIELKKRNVQLAIGKNTPLEYDKKAFLRVYQGYDFLENLIAIRPYILRKYKITNYLLEILLYLAPKQFYTKHDFMKLPRNFTYIKVESLLETGLFKIVVDARFVTYKVYGLSVRGRNLVKEYYQFLSGEKVISLDSHCPFKTYEKDMNKIDTLRVNLLNEIYKKSISETKKELFSQCE